VSIAKSIKQHIKSLGANAVFTTKQLLHHGSRNAIDLTLSRLVKKAVVIRLAAGVFIAVTGLSELPPALVIIEAKAKAFDKRALEPSNSYAGKPAKDSTVFLTDGCRTSFCSIHGRLYFKPASLRKLKRLESDRKPTPMPRCFSSRDSTPNKNPAEYGGLPSFETPALTTLLVALMLKQILNKSEFPQPYFLQFCSNHTGRVRLPLPANSPSISFSEGTILFSG
jgi:hypothetical protein